MMLALVSSHSPHHELLPHCHRSYPSHAPSNKKAQAHLPVSFLPTLHALLLHPLYISSNFTHSLLNHHPHLIAISHCTFVRLNFLNSPNNPPTVYNLSATSR